MLGWDCDLVTGWFLSGVLWYGVRAIPGGLGGAVDVSLYGIISELVTADDGSW